MRGTGPRLRQVPQARDGGNRGDGLCPISSVFPYLSRLGRNMLICGINVTSSSAAIMHR